jgi:hypothetical protein
LREQRDVKPGPGAEHVVHHRQHVEVGVRAAHAEVAEEHVHLLARHRDVRVAAGGREVDVGDRGVLLRLLAKVTERLLEAIERLLDFVGARRRDVAAGRPEPLVVVLAQVLRPQLRDALRGALRRATERMVAVDLLAEAARGDGARVVVVGLDLGQHLGLHAAHLAAGELRLEHHLAQQVERVLLRGRRAHHDAAAVVAFHHRAEPFGGGGEFERVVPRSAFVEALADQVGEAGPAGVFVTGPHVE